MMASFNRFPRIALLVSAVLVVPLPELDAQAPLPDDIMSRLNRIEGGVNRLRDILDRADLVPLPREDQPAFGGFEFCRLVTSQSPFPTEPPMPAGLGLQVLVGNNGLGKAGRTSRVRVTFITRPGDVPEQYEEETRDIPAGETDLILFPVPISCFMDSPCRFNITVDALRQVREYSELNNSKAGQCLPIQ